MARLADNIAILRQMVRRCALCPRRCGVDRAAGQVGSCGVGEEALVSSAGPHFGEEPPLVAGGGSGTIFLAGCNLHCVFCQNHDISQSACGRAAPPQRLAAAALALQAAGCVNVNFVSPTHVAHAVAEAVWIARGREAPHAAPAQRPPAGAKGNSGRVLTVPVVYNCGGYDSVEVLRLLEGLVEIYMPDFKYADADAGRKYSGVEDYPSVARAALEEMFRQVGPLVLDGRGVARRGVLIRHLVMPGDIAGSRRVIDIVAEAAPGSTINVMAQYRPAYRAAEYPELLVRPSFREIAGLRDHARSRGLSMVG